MRRSLADLAGLAFGATLGGLLVGLAEGLYHDVSLGWAMLLYGTLWAVAAAGLAVLSPLWRNQPVPSTQVRWGLILSVVPSVLLLVRFIMIRDFLQDSAGKDLMALGAGVLAALAAWVVILYLARAIRRRLAVEQLVGPRSWVLPLVVVAIFAVRAQGGDEPLPEEPPAARLDGRGVVLVVFDALRADVLGCYGAQSHREEPPSPSFDALAKRGLTFADASAQASWTRPAVASLMTSRHVTAHDTMSKTAVLPAELPTIASVLAAARVSTAAVVTSYDLEDGFGFSRGFDTYRYLTPARYLGAPPRANRLAAYNVYRRLREKLFRSSREARYFYRSGHNVNTVAFEILDQIGHGDFFLYLHYMEPHDPFFDRAGESWAKVSDPLPPTTWAGDMLAAYRDEVHRSDAVLRELTDGLEARGLGEKVTLIVTSDHGEELADHGGFYHGVTLYEELLHLPLIIAGPGITPGTDSRLARQIDIAPTVANRFGINPPTSWEGRDLLGDSPAPARTLAEESHEGNILTSIRAGQHKLVLANEDNPRGLAPVELYDLASDPGEQLSLTSDTQTVDALRAQIAEMQETARRGGATAGSRAIDPEIQEQPRALRYIQ